MQLIPCTVRPIFKGPTYSHLARSLPANAPIYPISLAQTSIYSLPSLIITSRNQNTIIKVEAIRHILSTLRKLDTELNIVQSDALFSTKKGPAGRLPTVFGLCVQCLAQLRTGQRVSKRHSPCGSVWSNDASPRRLCRSQGRRGGTRFAVEVDSDRGYT